MIDEKRIRENLELISFPRLSGTQHERRAFNILKEKIEDLNLEPSVQDFSFTSFYPKIYQKIAFLSSFWGLFIFYLNIGLLFTLINLIVILTILIPVVIITRRPEKIRIGKKKTSQNLYVKILGNSESNKSDNSDVLQDNNRGDLLFFAHIDSKGQRLHTNYRVFFFKLWIISLICGTIVIILRNLVLVQYSYWLLIIGGFIVILDLIAVIVLCFNTTNNKSPGAIDNAAGIVCVLELLNYYLDTKNRLKNYNLWFFFTGAEENGTMGVRFLYNKIKHLDRDVSRTFFLLFDTIGNNIDVITGQRGAFFFKNTNGFSATHYLPKRIKFTRSDAYFLADKKFGGLGVCDQRSYKYAHSKHDTPEKVDTILLKKLLDHIILILTFVDKRGPQ